MAELQELGVRAVEISASVAEMVFTMELNFERDKNGDVCVVVNFLSQLIFIFLLFWGMVMYAYEFETKEKQKLTKIKN